MTEYSITLQPINKTIQVKKDEMILDAAIRQGIDVAYTCRNGTCRTCIFEGEVVPHDVDVCMISQQELVAGRRLLCMSSLKSDAIVEKAVRLRSIVLITIDS